MENSSLVEQRNQQLREDLISNFIELTGGSSVERAQYFLEAANWNLEVAAGTYFETQDDDFEIIGRAGQAERPDVEILEEHRGVSPVPIVEEPPESNEQYLSSSDEDDIQVIGKAQSYNKRKNNMSDRKKFATLFSDKDSDEGKQSRREGNGRETSGSSDEEGGKDTDRGQAFFAGGGQQVLGPEKKKSVDSGQFVTDLFAKAKEHGAEPLDPSEESKAGNSRRKVFGGGGYRLGTSATSSEFEEIEAVDDAEPSRRTVTVTLMLWEDGFSLDDGPLRPYDHQESKQFLESIRSGKIPAELTKQYPNTEIDLHMKNNHGQKYKASTKPFSGKGQMLGSAASRIVVKEEATRDTVCNSAAAAREVERDVEVGVDIDDSQPVTAIQIRFSDGTRLQQKFNLSHRIKDIRSFICRRREEFSAQEFVLMTNFPNRILMNESLTLDEAGLKNAVVVMKKTGQ